MNNVSIAQLPLGACVVLCDINHNVLVVTRPDGRGVGLPGGRLEPGEKMIDAARRELWEETGFIVSYDDMWPIHRGVCRGSSQSDVTYNVTTFFAAAHSGVLQHKEPLVRPFWSNWQELLNNSPFADYNTAVARSLSVRYPSMTRHLSGLSV